VTVDHLGQEPLYQQLAAILRQMIESGALEPGQPLPSESYLQQEHGVSRGTVRMAVRTLRDEGLVVTLAGRGTFVARGQGLALTPGNPHVVTSSVRAPGNGTPDGHLVRSPGRPPEVCLY